MAFRAGSLRSSLRSSWRWASSCPLGGIIGLQVAGLATDLPRYQATIKEKVGSLRAGTIGRLPAMLKDFSKAVEEAPEGARPPGRWRSLPAPPEPSPLPVEVHERERRRCRSPRASRCPFSSR